MKDDYFKVLALSQSLIPALQVSPAHMLAAFETEKKQTAQMKRGSLTHVLLYTPQDFEQLYAVYEGPTGGKGSRTALDDFKKESKEKGLEVTSPEDLDESRRLVDFLKSDVYVQHLMKNAAYEVPFITEHPDYGVPIKGKFDCISDEYISDLKTTSCNADVWMRRAADSQTFLQSAWYLMLGRLMDGKQRRFVFKVIDVRPPYQIYLIEPKPDLMKVANKRCEEALRKFERAYKSKSYPHNPTQVLSWDIPYYLKGELNGDPI